jgi:uncharacterized protein
MKYLVILAVVVLVLWLLRGAQRGSARRAPPPKAPPRIEDMVSCAQCGVHLPRSEALPGRGGLYCGEAHRAEHERELAGR